MGQRDAHPQGVEEANYFFLFPRPNYAAPGELNDGTVICPVPSYQTDNNCICCIFSITLYSIAVMTMWNDLSQPKISRMLKTRRKVQSHETEYVVTWKRKREVYIFYNQRQHKETRKQNSRCVGPLEQEDLCSILGTSPLTGKLQNLAVYTFKFVNKQSNHLIPMFKQGPWPGAGLRARTKELLSCPSPSDEVVLAGSWLVSVSFWPFYAPWGLSPVKVLLRQGNVEAPVLPPKCEKAG